MSSQLRTSLAAAGIGLLLAGVSQAQQMPGQQVLPNLEIPTVNADNLGFRVFLVREYLHDLTDKSVPVSYDGQTQNDAAILTQTQRQPRALTEVDFILQDEVSGIICESKLAPIINADRPFPMTHCAPSRDPLAQFAGGEQMRARDYFDGISQATELMDYDPETASQSVVETITMTKDEFSFSLQREWRFSQEGDVSVCLGGQMWMEGIDAPISSVEPVCNEEIPVTDYMGDIFIEHEADLGPLMFPDMYGSGPSQF